MSKRDIRQDITDKIIRQLEQVNVEEFEAPFARLAAQGMPTNPTTGNNYHGINVPSLWVDQQECGFGSNEWATFKQWKEKGAQVRKGEKGSAIIFYTTWNKSGEGENGEAEEQTIPVMRFYSVFNADQVDGYEASNPELENEPVVDLVQRLETVDAYCTKTGADIREGGTRAFYRRCEDFISMPPTTAFVETKQASATENYYSVLLHELTHWTGAPKRLERDKARHKGERTKYAFEELVAELGAAFLCTKLGITQTTRECHAQYIKSWLAALKNDATHIFKAAAEAAKATDYLDNLQG